MPRKPSSMPALKVRRGRMPDTEQAKSFFNTESGSWVGAATRIGMDDMQTLIFMQTRVSETRNATRRNKGVLGRIYNALTGERPDYVQLPGNILMRVLNVVQGCPDWMETAGEYEERVVVAEDLLTGFKTSVAGDDMEASA